MKLKFLTLLLTLGLFTFGANAAEEKAPQLTQVQVQGYVDTILSKVCSAVNGIASKDKLPPVCVKACESTSANPDIKDLAACMTVVLKDNNTVHPAVEKAFDSIKSACGSSWSPICSGSPFGGTCSNKTVRDLCAAVCCTIDPATVEGNCMEKNDDKCANHKVALEALPPEMTKANW